MPKYPVMCLISVLLAAPAAYAANVRLQVEGLSGELEKRPGAPVVDHA